MWNQKMWNMNVKIEIKNGFSLNDVSKSKYIETFYIKKILIQKFNLQKITSFIHWKFILHSKIQAFTWSFWLIYKYLWGDRLPIF
jgi:hypothetical protein